jgi:hypothetical protein
MVNPSRQTLCRQKKPADYKKEQAETIETNGLATKGDSKRTAQPRKHVAKTVMFDYKGYVNDFTEAKVPIKEADRLAERYLEKSP